MSEAVSTLDRILARPPVPGGDPDLDLVEAVREGLPVATVDRVIESGLLSSVELDRLALPRKTLAHRRTVGRLHGERPGEREAVAGRAVRHRREGARGTDPRATGHLQPVSAGGRVTVAEAAEGEGARDQREPHVRGGVAEHAAGRARGGVQPVAHAPQPRTPTRQEVQLLDHARHRARRVREQDGGVDDEHGAGGRGRGGDARPAAGRTGRRAAGGTGR